jgi:hypothetical protein
MRQSPLCLASLVALAFGCGTGVVPPSPQDDAAADAAAATDVAPDDAESFPCSLRVPALEPLANSSSWSAWVRADGYNIPSGCGPAHLQDGIARFTPPTSGRWVFQASGTDLVALSARTVCEDLASTRACRDRPGGVRAFTLDVRAGEPLILLARGCRTAGTACNWRIQATPAPPDHGPCVNGAFCGAGDVCQRFIDEPGEEPRCVVAEAPRVVSAVMEVGDGMSRFEVAVEDNNRDATEVTLTLLDAAGAEVSVSAPGFVGTHSLTRVDARWTVSTRYLHGVAFGAAPQARFVARDATGRVSEARVVPFSPIRYRTVGESCLDGARCGPGLCCWYHYSAAICQQRCDR